MNEKQEHLYFLNSIYRDCVLPKILGTDTSDILYWAGKEVSRKYDLSTIDDLQEFFDMANFGELTISKDKHHMIILKLSGQCIIDRINGGSAEFGLESGIIAEALAKQLKTSAESSYEIDTKKSVVSITVLCD